MSAFKKIAFNILILFAVFCSAVPLRAAEPDARPNILLIVADDLGYADLGVFGSDIQTPNIDALAGNGLIFTQFHTAPLCAPTRAMLLSGNNNHVAGMGRMGALGPVQLYLPGYETHLSDRIAPLPRLLREAGYHTYAAGKWHLGDAVEHGPEAAGFEKAFMLAHGAGNHFNDVGFTPAGSVYHGEGRHVSWPDGAYSTEIFTDFLIESIDADLGDGGPFFAYAAYTSPHWPLQVPEEDLDLYRGHYEQGYDRLREERFASLKAAGIIPSSSELPPRNDAIAPWDALDAEQRRIETRKMQLYAAMVENLDRHVGRLVDHLKARGVYDNTLIVFMSDNGAAAEDFYTTSPSESWQREHYDNSYENMGQPDSWVAYGPQWAEAGSAPFSRYKGYGREGGLVAAMIVSGPGLAVGQRIHDEYLTVMDLAPTFLELAGARYPEDGSVMPMLGESMLPFLEGRAPGVHDENYTTTLYHGGYAFIRQGSWKLSNLEPPFAESKFELFDLEADPGETTNLSESEPDRYADMIRLWRSERRRLGIVLPEDL